MLSKSPPRRVISPAVTKSETGTWDMGRGDVGRGDVGLGDAGKWGRGDAGTRGGGDARGFEDVINK